ncbi:nucleolar pre-ribosomal-associated protein 1 [Venturia canescens]|uniref:nucleolar pre-ribosomal-associated protein 1 n=1 Tax=Venturia canescens TaxID=32260 RepID=UPI001C9D4798|nr:nucleolar pre-ribosomal-associated protein 1 [Venturia canescens]
MKRDLDGKKRKDIIDDTLKASVRKKKLGINSILHNGISDEQNNVSLLNFHNSSGKEKEQKNKKRKGGGIQQECCVIQMKKPKINSVTGETASVQDRKEIGSNGFSADVSQIDADRSDEGEEAIANISNEEANSLSGKSLRKRFNSNEGLNTLRKFLVACKELKDRDLAAEYLHAGGNVLEILRLLDTSDKKNVNNASAVFSAIHLIIMKILSEYPHYRSNAQEACRHLINSHLSFVHGMLSSQSNAKHRKIVLRLLASMVSLGGNLPQELLAHTSFHTQVLETLSQQTKPTDSSSVRTCYIHFVLAFLVEGNSSVIRALLDKRGMLSCIFPELTYDSHTTVHLVLDTVKSWVLENSAISKTTKLHVFSTPVLQSLVSLYNWKGPKNWPGPKSKKRERTDTDFVDPEEKKIAVEAVHNFLITLLTSNRHGVIFHDRSLGTSTRKYNQLVNTILQSLERPWEHPKPLDLVIKILVACPDLVKSQLAYTEPFLEPRLSKKWILAMRFLGHLLDSENPENCLKPCLSELSSSQLLSAVQNLTIPLSVLKGAITRSLENEIFMIRHEGIRLLMKMLRQAKIFANIVQEQCDEADYILFRNSMTDYILKNVPSLEKMFKLWNLGLADKSWHVENNTSDREEIKEFMPSKLQHLNAILDMFEAYREMCPGLEIALSASGELSSKIFITGLDEISTDDEEESSHCRQMKIKALRFILSIDSASFTPNEPLFGTTLVFLLTNLVSRKNDTDFQSRKTVKMLLLSSGIFEGCQDQIDFWIENLADLKSQDEKNLVAHWFVKVVEMAITKTDEYLELVVEAETDAVDGKGFAEEAAKRMQDFFDDLRDKDGDISQPRIKNIASAIAICPIVFSAIENAQKICDPVISKYLSLVMIEILHCQVDPGTLVRLARNLEQFSAKEYLNSWLPEQKPTSMKKEISAGFFSRRTLSKALLKDDDGETIGMTSISNIFQGSVRKTEFLYQGEEIVLFHDFDQYEIYILFRMTLYYLSQFIQRGQFSEKKFDSHKSCLIALLHMAKSLDTNLLDKCCKLIFAHPTIFQHFSPYYRSKNNAAIIVTAGLVDIFQTAIDINDSESLPTLFLPYKNKLIAQLSSAVKKAKDGKKVKSWMFVIEFIEILRPMANDVVQLLTRIIDLPQSNFLAEKTGFTIWTDLVPKLIEILTMRKNCHSSGSSSIIKPNIVKKIMSRLIQLKTYPNIRLDSWESNLQRYLEHYPQCIAGIDGHAFNSLLKSCKNSATISLIAFLVSRNDQFILHLIQFISYEPKIITENDLIFSIIANRSSSYPWTQHFLKQIHHHYKNDVIRYFTEPEQTADNWISRNIKAVAFLIDSCFETKDCETACEGMLSNGDRLDNVDLGFVQLLTILFTKSSKLESNSEESLTKLIQVLMRITVSTLKKDAKNEEKLETLCQSLINTIDLLRSKQSDFIHEELSKNYSWPQFTRFSLKLGLKASKEGKKHASLLKTLARVCDVAYKDASENEYVKTLFDMTTSHSEFVNLILSTQNLKRDLAELILVLIRKNHSTMSSSQIPLYLAAYNATLSETDQFIFLILQHYEANKIKFNEYRPYLWGEAAASHYSVRGEADTALWRQPSTSQVLDLFNSDMVEETIKRFPVNRDLKPSGLSVATAKVYDPSFYLPLMSYLLSDNNVVACHKVTQSGALALVFAASGSACVEIRLAAYTVISRFYLHLEATSSKEKCLWIRLIDAVRNGILDTNSSLKDFRPSCLVSTFLARAALVTTQPTNLLYSPIQAFLMAKPALEFNVIPELLQLFQSSDVEHTAHRHWILRVIRDGMKTQVDMDVALKSVVFKMLLDFYSCLLADPITKHLILEIIESTVKIKKAGLLLTQSYGLVVWLAEISSNLTTVYQTENVQVIVSIIREILNSVTRTNDRDKDTQFLLLNVLKNVSCSYNLSKNTSVSCFNNYMSSLSEILQNKSLRSALTRQDLEKLVEIGKNIYGDVDDILDTLENGAEFAARIDDSKVLDDEISIGRANLRKAVFFWCGRATR